MGGAIWVESAVGEGSAFFFTVVVRVGHAGGTTGEKQDTTDSVPRQPLRILVVDDDIASRVLVEKMLRPRGGEVRSAQDGEEALALLAVEAFDVVLMDIRMPRMNGIEATKAIRELDRRAGRRTAVIALTAHALAGDKERFLAAGMDGYLTKPIRRDALFNAIETALQAPRSSDAEASHEPGHNA
jgi:CheY-like chemotaxis protein